MAAFDRDDLEALDPFADALHGRLVAPGDEQAEAALGLNERDDLAGQQAVWIKHLGRFLAVLVVVHRPPADGVPHAGDRSSAPVLEGDVGRGISIVDRLHGMGAGSGSLIATRITVLYRIIVDE